ncbi:hypothetical protein FAI40_06380 [Acetobacteraceae bacterium]|nr:hypothetical protein FAI40_06380 [Acetobacteraceae bacterium]
MMSRSLHWVVAAALLVIYVCGSLIFLYGPSKELNLVHWHQPVGVFVFVLTIWRLVMWLRVKKGETGRGIKHFLSSFTLPHYVQFGLLISCLLMPIFGVLMAFFGGYSLHLGFAEIPSFLPKNKEAADFFYLAHNSLAFFLVCLICLHIAGAIKAHFAKKALQKKLDALLKM